MGDAMRVMSRSVGSALAVWRGENLYVCFALDESFDDVEMRKRALHTADAVRARCVPTAIPKSLPPQEQLSLTTLTTPHCHIASLAITA